MTCFRMSDGRTMLRAAAELGISYSSVYRHADNGMTPDEAVAQALQRKGRKDNCVKYLWRGQNLRRLLSISDYQLYVRWMKIGKERQAAAFLKERLDA